MSTKTPSRTRTPNEAPTIFAAPEVMNPAVVLRPASEKFPLANQPTGATDTATVTPAAPRATKAALLRAMLEAPGGASLAAIMVATGWQAHTVRAALSGQHKAGMTLAREKVDGETVYRIVPRGDTGGTDQSASHDPIGDGGAIGGLKVGAQPHVPTGPDAQTQVETAVRS